MAPEKLRVDVWSDIACPWCYVGKRHLDTALAEFPHRSAVEVVWRSFELDPAAPKERSRATSYAARLASKYRCSVAEAETMIQRMVDVARADGLDFRFDRIRGGNMFDAHRVLHFARERGVQDAVKERFLRAYMTEGALMSDPETLATLGSEAGLDASDVRAMLASDRFERGVRTDERAASEIGVTGVPFFLVGGKYAVSGAQPAAVLLHALTKAWSERPIATPIPASFAEGAVCGPDGCEEPSRARRGSS